MTAGMTSNKTTEQQLSVDIAIIGGGLAGYSLAAALKQTELSVALVNAQSPLPENIDTDTNHFDDRALALSHSSISYLKLIEVLNDEDIDQLAQIEEIHVSDKGHIGMTRLKSEAVNKDFLGKVILAKQLGRSLSESLQQIESTSQLTHLYNTKVDSIEQTKDSANLNLSSTDEQKPQKISAKLVVLAEGGQSGLCEKLGLLGRRHNYEQVGVLANVSTSQAHNNVAYERFTSHGPMALLPLREKDYKLVWTVDTANADDVMQYDDSEFLKELQQEFGDRAGIFQQVGKRVSYPMYEVQRSAMVSGRVALIGNSAHTLHPIAGQGFNLGLRDIICLVDLLKNSDLNDLDVLSLNTQYAAARQQDVKRTSMFTDSLVRLFSNNFLPVSVLRNIGLIGLQNTPFMKNRFMRKLIGNTNN